MSFESPVPLFFRSKAKEQSLASKISYSNTVADIYVRGMSIKNLIIGKFYVARVNKESMIRSSSFGFENSSH